MSTKQDLLKAAKTLGITTVDKDSSDDEIRTAINAALGVPDLDDDDRSNEQKAGDDQRTDSMAAVLAKHGREAVASQTGPVVATEQNIPNLSPTGQWQGKRARIRRVKTGHNDMGGAIFRWNGWPTIVPLDTVVDVAWPIYEIMKQCVGMQMEITQEEDPRDKGRIHNKKNITYYDKYPYQFLGVTPGTEHLPESPWEYTLDQYVDDFPGFDVRKWRQLCILWEIADAQCEVSPGMKPADELEARRNAIHYALNLPQTANKADRERFRRQKFMDIGMKERAA